MSLWVKLGLVYLILFFAGVFVLYWMMVGFDYVVVDKEVKYTCPLCGGDFKWGKVIE